METDLAAGLRRARREFLRSAHPDRGGDPARFREGLAEFDRQLRDLDPAAQPPAHPPVRVVVVRRPRGLSGWAAHLRAQLTGPTRRIGRVR